MRKAIRILSLAVLAVTLVYVLFNAALYGILHSHAGSVGIIGGADGMTAIFITESPVKASGTLLPCLGIVLPIMGILLTKEK